MTFKKLNIHIPPHAEDVEFDPSNCDDIDSTDTQGAVEDLCNAAGLAASPGYSFGREGTHNAGTWLIATETASNKRGLPFGMNNGSIVKVTVATENIPSAFTVQIWYHDGNLSGQTLIGSVTTAGTASTEDFVVSWSVPQGHQLAAKISSTGATKPKETGVFLVVKGTVD